MNSLTPEIPSYPPSKSGPSTPTTPPPTQAAGPNRILSRMLERLYASIAGGPSINCRPHNSRQRIDLCTLSHFADVSPGSLLTGLLSDEASASIAARVPMPPGMEGGRFQARKTPPVPADVVPDASGTPAKPDEAAAKQQREYSQQQSLIGKLRVIIDESRTYENDTGVYVLNLGFPILSLPPGAGAAGSVGRRVLAPIAFIPVSVTVRSGATPVIDLACKEDEVDRVMPNEALLAWLEQQTGKARPETLYSDEEGRDPWKEVRALVTHVTKVLGMEMPGAFASEMLPKAIDLAPIPRADDAPAKPTIITAAILGLFPASNQGLLSDTKALSSGTLAPRGPIESFLKAGVSLDVAAASDGAADVPRQAAATTGIKARDFASERFVAPVDPCQARAVSLARTSAGLVVHGPPGTGKSQTITNIISDHLARGERVLFVCDKRTALDVVFNRLEHVGLGGLCALIHDPQRDQRDLYMSIRQQVEDLAEEAPAPKSRSAAEKLAKVDSELLVIHAELAAIHTALMEGGAGAGSLHELVGRWLQLSLGDEPTTHEDAATRLGALTPHATLDDAVRPLRELVRRANALEWRTNPWPAAVGLSLAQLLDRPVEGLRGSMATLVRLAEQADATRHESVVPFSATISLDQQAAARAGMVATLARAFMESDASVRSVWAIAKPEIASHARQNLASIEPAVQTLRSGTVDAELLAAIAGRSPSPAILTDQITALDRYIAIATSFWRFIAFSAKSGAASVLASLGLTLSPQNAARAREFLSHLRAATVVEQKIAALSGRPVRQTGLIDVAALMREHASHAPSLEVITALQDPAMAPAFDRPTRDALRAGSESPEARSLTEGLARSAPRAQALTRLELALVESNLFTQSWISAQAEAARKGHAVLPTIQLLTEQLTRLEEVVRLRDLIEKEPDAARRGLMHELLASGLSEDDALRAVERASLHAEISRRLAAAPVIRTLDPKHVASQMDRLRELQAAKLPIVVEAVMQRWSRACRERLVSTSGNRLSSLGAQVKQRLMTRGKNAMRLRQVMALGREIEGGDPIMDLRPIWMASPETVAQVFPRDAVFDVVVFDEASQLRLEDSLPVLTRAKRVVVAGDPKQLPPTRFFESALSDSETEEVETDQDLFEVSQREIEDLLTAALSLDIQQSYLDVHYRSRNASLIEFSNQHFYARRLQPIPTHPRNMATLPAVRLRHVGGVYADRANEAEAAATVELVKELLAQAKPPSIGIGCFNVAQRDLIMERLDEAAEQDAKFAKALGEARERRGKGSFDGLFVKNLENIQGDERDHIIISTTYGPDAKGRFYRRFGPLAMPGGGRRLNVLVTRAREAVHLLTSIPRSEYAALPEAPQGATPGGGWLLFAYLKYADALAAAGTTSPSLKGGLAAASLTLDSNEDPSEVARAIAEYLAATRAGSASVLNWGNEGFRVDLAYTPEGEDASKTIGLLCDGARYAPAADDPVGWDAFRCSILEGQGWKLQRVWTPELFRDPKGCVDRLIPGM